MKQKQLWASDNAKWGMFLVEGKVQISAYILNAYVTYHPTINSEGVITYSYDSWLPEVPKYVQKAVVKHWPYDLLVTTGEIEIQGVVYEKRPVNHNDYNGKKALIKVDRFKEELREEVSQDPYKRFVEVVYHNPLNSYLTVRFLHDNEYSDWDIVALECLLKPQWPLGKTRCMKCGERSPVLVQGCCPDCVNAGALMNVNI